MGDGYATMRAVAGERVTAEVRPNVTVHISDINNSVMQLFERAKMLEDKLAPVLVPPVPEGDQKLANGVVSMSQVSNDLCSIGGRLQELEHLLRRITERVDI